MGNEWVETYTAGKLDVLDQANELLLAHEALEGIVGLDVGLAVAPGDAAGAREEIRHESIVAADGSRDHAILDANRLALSARVVVLLNDLVG